MGIEQITKAEFDELFKEAVAITEVALREQLTTIKQEYPELEALTDNYLYLLDFRSQYRQEYKTHRIAHYLTSDNTITYKKIANRKIGFRPNDK